MAIELIKFVDKVVNVNVWSDNISQIIHKYSYVSSNEFTLNDPIREEEKKTTRN